MSERQLVCFDLGGVILRICRTWNDAFARAGVAVRPDIDLEALRSGDPAWRDAFHAYQSGRLSGPALVERLARRLDGAYDAEELARANHAWIIEEYPGALAFVSELATAGRDLAALSNTSHEHWLACMRYPAFRALRRRHASHFLGCCKPDEGIYREFEERTGWRGSEIVFFDDTAENVEGARAVGWSAHVIDHTGDPVAQMRAVLANCEP